MGELSVLYLILLPVVCLPATIHLLLVNVRVVCPIMCLVHEVLVMAIKLLPLLLQIYQAKIVPLFLATFLQSEEGQLCRSPSWDMKFPEILLHTLLACLRLAGSIPPGAQFYSFSLCVACFYVCFSLHSYSISCHCPPC